MKILNRAGRACRWALVLSCFRIVSLPAQESHVPLDLQWALIIKILSFDRNFDPHAGDEIVVGILFQGKQRASLDVKGELEAALEGTSPPVVKGLPVRPVFIDLDVADPAAAVREKQIDLLYIAPIPTYRIERISMVGRELEVPTFTGVPEYVESGLAVGIGLAGNKPLVVINLPAAKSEGVDFSSQLLKISKVIE